ncbi:fluoride efflux transporter CrcB [Alicyclobacillus sp.]|uniref:fluoride efflux transporter CrcB n=1 Tax=Alicyclobacillus sp. TaxID=61169 RepID=UPI0025C2F960|nr:fluoride efflux transporter CrcB [Alicyclobacillus sp.]MCL6515960.1 fluoride efflux transporter CrcB [Alicyclobacillus sp.]
MPGILWVGLGGIAGALLRYQLSKWIAERWVVSFPLATLLINVSGSFVLGLVTRQATAWFPGHAQAAVLLLGTGLCGAYTTFSTFSYEFTMLWREGRTQAALWYLAASCVLGLLAAWVGLHL